MNRTLLLPCALLLLSTPLHAGTLIGRIVREDGSALSKTSIAMQGQEVMTNQFGGYEITLPDGEYELTVTVAGQRYLTDKIRIYSPQTKQNWRLNPAGKRLEKIL